MSWVRPTDDRKRLVIDLSADEAEPLREAFGRTGGLVSVPWTVDTAVKLSEVAGRTIPTPAFLGDYGGRLTPRRYQRRTVDFMVRHKRGFVLNGLGTGKTSSALWAVEWLIEHGFVSRALILAPRSTLSFVWEAEVAKAAPALSCAVAYGSAKKRVQAIESGAHVVISNHDMVRLHDPEWVASHFDMVVVDEATVFKTWSSGGAPSRWKAMRKIAEGVDRVWLMTGTPTPNGPMDAWAMIKLVRPDWLERKTRWQSRVMVQVSQYRWVPREGAADIVAAAMQPAIRVTREQALKDLPPRTIVTRNPDLTTAQKRAIKELKARAVAELAGEEITAATAATLLLKLLQVASGGVRVDEETVVPVDMGPRLEDLARVVDEAGGKVIVFANFRHTVRSVAAWLNDRYGEGFADVVMGDVSQGERNRIFTDFQTGDLRVIVAHPATMAHGLTLTAADTIVWLGPPLKSELYEQGNARAWRHGQTRPVTIVNQVATSEEARLFRVLQDREALQSEVLRIVQGMLK